MSQMICKKLRAAHITMKGLILDASADMKRKVEDYVRKKEVNRPTFCNFYFATSILTRLGLGSLYELRKSVLNSAILCFLGKTLEINLEKFVVTWSKDIRIRLHV